MLDKLVDVLLQFIRWFQFCTVLMAYERGVVLRWGRFHREAGPGFHFMWPFHVEEILTTNVVPETMNVGPQSLTTKDGQPVVVATVVTFGIQDVRKFLLDIEGANQVIEDSTYGAVARFIMDRTWAQLQAIDIADELTKAVRKQARRYGVDVLTVQLSDFTRSRSFRILTPSAAVGRGVSIV